MSFFWKRVRCQNHWLILGVKTCDTHQWRKTKKTKNSTWQTLTLTMAKKQNLHRFLHPGKPKSLCQRIRYDTIRYNTIRCDETRNHAIQYDNKRYLTWSIYFPNESRLCDTIGSLRRRLRGQRRLFLIIKTISKLNMERSVKFGNQYKL